MMNGTWQRAGGGLKTNTIQHLNMGKNTKTAFFTYLGSPCRMIVVVLAHLQTVELK